MVNTAQGTINVSLVNARVKCVVENKHVVTRVLLMIIVLVEIVKEVGQVHLTAEANVSYRNIKGT